MLRGLLPALLLWLPFLAGAVEGTEQTREFRSEITVLADGTLEVLETIGVDARGRQIRHGIYRDFPTRYPGRFGTRHTTTFDLLVVTRDGRLEPWRRERLVNGVRIYVGDPNAYVAAGPHTYRIRYRSERQIGFGREFDQLYWNVTGNQWSFPILRAEAVVRLPDGIAGRLLSIEGWTGPQGATGSDFRVVERNDELVRLETTRPLAAGEGFTLRLRWPKGLIAEPAAGARLLAFLGDNYLLLLSVLLLAAMPLWYLRSWHRVGRDPEKGVIVPAFHPPRGLSPSATRYITRGRYDGEAFSAAVIDLAVKGWLKIVQESRKHYRLQRRDDAERNARGKPSPGERKIFRILLGGREEIGIGRKYDPTVRRANSALQKFLEEEYRQACFRDNRQQAMIGLVMGLGALLAYALHRGSLNLDLLLPVLFLTGFAALGAMSGKLVIAIVPMFMVVFFVASTAASTGGALPVGLLVMALAVAGLFALFSWLLKAPTPFGRKVLDEIEGFRLYLATAEQDRLNLLHPPEKTPELFERYLPYALALEVENQWTAQFSGILNQAAREEREGYRPAWYSGSRLGDFSPGNFAGALGAGLASSVAAASTAPSSGGGGGFGGGGSSGGGGGGGGGGGW